MSINLVVTTDVLRAPLTGIGHYTANLLKELLRSTEINDINGLRNRGLDTRQQLIDQLARLDNEQSRTNESESSRARSLAQRLTAFSPAITTGVRHYHRFRCSRFLRQRTDYLLHAPDFISPEFLGKTVLTIHDLSHRRYPETHPQHRVHWLNHALPNALARADRIICVSEFTKRELLDLGLVSDDTKLRVCLNGVDPGFKPRGEMEISRTLGNFKLRYRGYILSVATLEPRKNLTALIDAYAALPKSIATDFPLVLIGSQGWKSRKLMERISCLPSSHKILITGYVDNLTLQHLLCGASLFAYCSIYEGFGLPVIEAMASGTPVLISNADALREVAGNAACSIDINDPGSLRHRIMELLEKHQLSDALRAKGVQRAAQFSWEKCAQETIAVYSELA